MKKLLSICLSIVIAGFMFTSCGPDDIKIQSDVKEVLLLNSPKTTGRVYNGIVTLKGTAESEARKAEIIEMVKAVKDVKSVVDEVTVLPPAKPAITPDESLHAAINVAMQSAGYKDVEIIVKDEVVTLRGTVKKADQKKVMAVAQGFKSKKVVNELK